MPGSFQNNLTPVSATLVIVFDMVLPFRLMKVLVVYRCCIVTVRLKMAKLDLVHRL